MSESQSPVIAWLTKLDGYSWWDKPLPWLKESEFNFWFIPSSEGDEGYFLVDTESDTYEVFPPLSYQMNDSFYSDEWWLKEGVRVQFSELGKWQFLYGLHGPRLPKPSKLVAQEIWPLIRGGWNATPRTRGKSPSWIGKLFGLREKHIWSLKQEPSSFREYLSQAMNVSDEALWDFASLLTSFNLGFAFIPISGNVSTFEMQSLEVATSSPDALLGKYKPVRNLRKVGVGTTSLSWGISGTGGSKRLNPQRYREILGAINRPITTPKAFIAAVEVVTREFNQKTFRKKDYSQRMLPQVLVYLQSQAAVMHFEELVAAGYAPALIPLGGRTFWWPGK